MNEILKDFYLIVPPGFEGIAAQELRFWLPPAEISEQSRGGIGFKAAFAEGCELNQVLKVPTRILVRLADFGCRDFPKLFKKVKTFPWAEWLPKNSKVEVEASTHQSRLKIKKRIESTVLDALERSGFKRSSGNEAGAFIVYVRLVEDVCYLSLDTSGEILHKRGYREYSPDAPLRENLAAGILLHARQLLADVFPERDEKPMIVDPMAGSGTFLIEAVKLYSKSDREFAFQKFNSYSPSNYRFPVESTPWITGVFGIESDTKAVVAAQRAFELAKVDDALISKMRSVDRGVVAEILHADIFLEPPTTAQTKISNIRKSSAKILVCNPPYGKRLKIEEPFSKYYPKLFNRCQELFAPDVASIILPQKVNLERLKLPAGWQLHDVRPFSNGGFSVQLTTFVCSLTTRRTFAAEAPNVTSSGAI